MPRNGSGNYSLPPGINPVITQTLITSSWANVTLSDVAAALTQSISKDGQTTPTANLPMGGYRHTGCGDPVLRDNYATLGYVQDGSHYQLINVAGQNAISADLPGGLTVYSLGMIVQLQPTANSTGAVTLDVNGIGPKKIVAGSGNQLGAGDILTNKAYLLMYNGISWEVINGGDASAIAQAAMSGWDRPASTAYPLITQVNPTTVNVPGGTGRIIDPSARDISGSTEVSWATQDVPLTNLASAWTTILGVNASGTIMQLTGTALPTAARSHIILGMVSHVTGVIDAIRTRPAIYGDMTYAAYDLSSIFNNMLLNGGAITQNATLMHMDLAAGVVWQLGGLPNQVNGPNIVGFVGQPNFNFYPITGASTNTALTNVAPVGNYDPAGAGVVTAIPGGAGVASIHRIYAMNGVMIWLYGQNTYTDLQTAIANMGIDTQTLKLPAKLNNATLISLIIVTKGCTDLSVAANCRIVPQGGTNYSIGVAGSISEAPADGKTYGRKNTAWSVAVDAVVPGNGIAVNAAAPGQPVVTLAATFAGPLTMTGGDLTFSGLATNILYSNPSFKIRATTADAADSSSIAVCGGGDVLATRGALLQLFGNENGTGAGRAIMTCGNGADISLNNGPVNIPTGDLNMAGSANNLRFTSVDFRIMGISADGADNQAVRLVAGGGVGNTRGASISLYGNEHASAGLVTIQAGAAANIELGNGDVKIFSGRLYGDSLDNNSTALTGPTNQYVGSGTYTPVLTNTTNITSSSVPNQHQWIRVGNVVTVSGYVQCTPTAVGGCEVQMTLPLASNFTALGQCVGSGACGGAARVALSVNADSATDRARLSFDPTTTAVQNLWVQFTYLIL